MKIKTRRAHRVTSTAKRPAATVYSTTANVNLAAVVAEWKETTDRANAKLRAALNLAAGGKRVH